MRSCGVVVGLMLVCASAWADDESSRLFDEGGKFRDEGKWAEACEAFAKSEGIAKAPGTELNLGNCNAQLGHAAEAFRWYGQAAAGYEKEQDPDRAAFARKQASELLPKIGTIVLRIDGVVTGLAITVAGRAVTPAAEVHEYVDPGEIEIHASAAASTFDREVTVAPGETTTIDLRMPEPPRPPPPPPPTIETKTERRASRVKLAYTIGAVGGAATVTGVVIGLVARSRYNDAIAHCGPGPVCEDPWFGNAHSASSLSNVATIVGTGGLALVAAGATLYLTAPRDVIVVPGVGGHAMTLGLQRAF